MECLLGISGKDCVVIAADCTAGHSIAVMKHDQDKIVRFGSNMAAVVCGEHGDTAFFGEYIQKNITLYRMRHQYPLSLNGTANFTRNALANFLRSRTPYMVNLLLAGCNEEEGPGLYYLDYLGTMAKVPFGAHGYGSYFSLSIMDRLHRPDMGQEECVKAIQECIKEVNHRLIINLPSFKIYVVTSEGVTLVEDE